MLLVNLFLFTFPQLQHRTSEICQMEKLMIDDLRQEIEDSKKLEQDILKYEGDCHNEDVKNNCSLDQEQQGSHHQQQQQQSLFDQIKNEIKSEETHEDSKQNLDIQSNNDSNSNFFNNLQNTTTTTSSSLDSIKNEIKTESLENSMASAVDGKSCSSSMDSFDLLKQSPVNTNANMAKDKPNESKEFKKEEPPPPPPANHWVQGGYMESKGCNNYYGGNNLSNATMPLQKTTNLFNGCLKKASPAITTSTSISNSSEEKKDQFENFDIESEITPSFIMKKVEHKEAQQQTTATSTPTVSSTNASVSVAAATTTTTTSTTATSLVSHKKLKMPKLNIVSETATSEVTPQSNDHHQSQQTNQNSSNANDVLPNNFDFSQHLHGNNHSGTKQQEEDWLCIQKELNLMNSSDVNQKNVDNQSKSLDFLTQETSQDLFPSNQQRQQQNQHQLSTTSSSCNVPSSLPNAGSCGQQQQQQPDLSLNHEESNHQAELNEFFSGSEDSEVHKAVETRLESMFGESPVHLSGGSKDNAESPYNLEIMYGESAKSSAKLFGDSPVHLTGSKERGDSPYNMAMLFGDSAGKSDANSCNVKAKSNWETDFSTNSFVTATQQQHQTNFANTTSSTTTNNMPHQIQLGSANNPRWMQNMEAQFPVFQTSNNGNSITDCLAPRKRQWNGHMVDESNQQSQQQQPHQQQQQQGEGSPQKKLCGSIPNVAGLNDSSTSSHSPLNPQQQQQQQAQQHHNIVPNDTSHAQDLMDAALLSLHDGLGVEGPVNATNTQANSYNHMVMNATSFNNFSHLDAQQQQQIQQSHFMNVDQQHQQMMQHMNHHAGVHHQVAGGGSGEFDDDITRHVQNAIDSILNLQSSEADSLSFSLDHSMGALLGNTILNDNQAGQNTTITTGHHETVKRQQLVDELGECLMGGGNSSTDASNLTDSHLLMDTSSHHHGHQQQHHSQLMQHDNIAQHSMNNHHHSQQQQLTDFNCVVDQSDEPMKSIISS